MAKFNVGDEVMVRSGVPAPHDFRGVVGKITRLSDRGYFVMTRSETGPSSAEVHFLEAELKPASRRSTKSLRAKYSKSFVPTEGQTAWVIWDGERYWSPSGWVEEGSDKARYFRSRETASRTYERLRQKGEVGRYAQVIDVKG